MGAALYLWKTGKFDVFEVNPPLTRIIAGLPVALADPKWNWKDYSADGQDRREWGLGRAFVAANDPQETRWYFALARWACVPLVVVGGWVGYRLASKIYGHSSGFVFLTLWTFSPFVLGWGATMCPDVAAASMGIIGAYFLLRWLESATWGDAFIAGLSLGLLPLSKTTWIIAFGIWPAVWIVWRRLEGTATSRITALRSASCWQLGVVIVLALFLVNLVYCFDGSLRPLGEYQFISKALAAVDNSERAGPPVTGNRFVATWLGEVPVPLPADFVQGIDTQRHDFERGLPSYLRGEHADHGWWFYYLYALAVKVPLGTWCLVCFSVGVTILGRGFNAPGRDEIVVLAPGLVILVFVSSQTGFSAHSRYVIPALPFFFVWISKVARVFEMRPLTRKRRVMAAMVVLAMTWSVTSSLWAYPHSLSYFNELTGGPKGGGEHLLGSNIDWGQDLLYLKDWLDDHPHVTLDGLAFYGSYPATLAGIPKTPHPPTDSEGPTPGWHALSVNYLYGRSGQFRYFLRFEPVAMAGYSIYIYHITLDDANRVRRELGLPELAADWRREKERGATGQR